jgi:hypothetical protein
MVHNRLEFCSGLRASYLVVIVLIGSRLWEVIMRILYLGFGRDSKQDRITYEVKDMTSIVQSWVYWMDVDMLYKSG